MSITPDAPDPRWGPPGSASTADEPPDPARQDPAQSGHGQVPGPPLEQTLLDGPVSTGWSGRGLVILTLVLAVALVVAIVVAVVYWWTPGLDPVPVPTVSQA